VVKVKVLGVDQARKRISLTMRLDDEPDGSGGAVRQGPAGTRDRRGDQGRDPQGRDPQGQKPRSKDRRGGGGQTPGPDGAMADALRRAGLA
jgi:protein Tex